MRLEMSKRTDLALRALNYLNDARRAGGAEVATAIGTSSNFLPQVLKPLVDRGWITGTPGPRGGYNLEIELGRLSVLDVVRATEGIPLEEQCVLRGVPCPAPEPCALHDSWVQARDALLAELSEVPVVTAPTSAPTKGE